MNSLPLQGFVSLNTLFDMQENAQLITEEINQYLEKLKGKSIKKKFEKEEDIFHVIKNYISVTEELSRNVKVYQRTHQDSIPPNILTTLTKSEELIKDLAKRIPTSKFLNHLRQTEKKGYLDPYHLLLTPSVQNREISNAYFQWYLNLGLLMNVYSRTEDLGLKKEIGFLVLNYLAKVAPYRFEELGLNYDVQEKLNQMFNHGLIEPEIGIVYNRESPVFDGYLQKDILKAVALASGNQFFIIGTKEIEDLLSVWFSVLPTDVQLENGKDKWADAIVDVMRPQMNQLIAVNFDDYVDPPLLMDCTTYLEHLLFTYGSEEKNQLFQKKLELIERQLDEAIILAAEKLKNHHPLCDQTEEERQRLIVYLRSNIVCICRAELKKAGMIKTLPIFDHTKYAALSPKTTVLSKFIKKIPSSADFYAFSIGETNKMRGRIKLNDFVNSTGIRMGSVQGRQTLVEFMSLEELIQFTDQSFAFYSMNGLNRAFYNSPLQLTQTSVFQRFEKHMANPGLLKQFPYLRVLGCSTLQLVKGLLNELEKHEKWIEFNNHPDRREIVQNSLFQLLQHLTLAENHLKDFGKFIHAIELIHYEMAALLKLFSPFTLKNFVDSYHLQLRMIPVDLQAPVKIGLARSSMNTLAGINAILHKMVKQPYCVFQEETHFEISRSMEMGQGHSLTKTLQNPVDAIDLYIGDFNHNVNLDIKHKIYRAADVIGDIEALLKAKPKTKCLTVAIDCTIDFLYSQKTKALLEHFSEKIKDGQFNFVFFRSGQKFDMLGMDNYYGCPFYIVNNGDNYWQPFNALLTQEAYTTDLLSTQWFALVSQSAPNATDDYRGLIFENTREILNKIPEILKPGGNAYVKVCEVDKDVNTCFIDIKITGKEYNKITDNLKQLLYNMFAEKNAKIHTRGGYGFFNPNVCIFSSSIETVPGNTIRINPGLDLKETELIIEFLNKVAKLDF